MEAPDAAAYIAMDNEKSANGSRNFDMGKEAGPDGVISFEPCLLNNAAVYEFVESGGAADYPDNSAPGGTYDANSWGGGSHPNGSWVFTIRDDAGGNATCIGDAKISYCTFGVTCPEVQVEKGLNVAVEISDEKLAMQEEKELDSSWINAP